MTVGACGSDVKVTPDMTVANVMAAMSEKKIGVAVVIDGGQILGVATKQHLDRRAEELGPTIAASRVRESMVGPVKTVPASTVVLEAANIMRAEQVRLLGLIDDQGAYVGLVTLRRVLYEVMDELDLRSTTSSAS